MTASAVRTWARSSEVKARTALAGASRSARALPAARLPVARASRVRAVPSAGTRRLLISRAPESRRLRLDWDGVVEPTDTRSTVPP